MLKPAAAGLAISSLCLSFVAEVPAQNAAKKKSAIKQTQAVEEPAADKGAQGKAQAPAGTENSSQIPRPEVDAMRVEKPDPALEKVLKDWELYTSRFKKLVGRFELFRYDPIFEVEKRAEGKFAHEAPDKGSYEKLGTVIAPGAQARKKNRDGELYKLESDSPERWVCTGKEVIKINDKEKTFEKIEIPPAARGENIIEGPLPFLFGMKAERAKERYKMRIMKKNDTEIWLGVIPRKTEEAGNWQQATVIIDAQSFVPKAVKLLDPTGAETVHLFKDVQINPKKGWKDFWEADPFAPNLRRYQQVLSPDKTESASGGRSIPPGNTKQSSSPASKSRAASDGTSRSADAQDASGQRKKSGSATERK
jgi:TIGR03009 family protein